MARLTTILFFVALICSIYALNFHHFGQSPISCDPNEEYSQCASDCEVGCYSLTDDVCSSPCKAGCICMPGYRRQNPGGNCVLAEDC